MSFSSPAVLWALPAAALPLLLHLLSRRRAQRLPFADLALLRTVHAQALPRARVRQWLLVAARCSLLLLMILAYAGPVIEAQGSAKAAAGTGKGLDLVVLLDASYSMGAVEGGRRRFDAAKLAAGDLLKSLKPSDRVAFGVFSDRLEEAGGPLAWVGAPQALEALSRAALSYRGTDYAAALRAACALPREPGRERAVLLLSDGARHGLRSPLPPIEQGTTFLGLAWAQPPRNSYVASAGPAPESTALKPRLKARAAAFAPTSLELWQGGQRAQALSVERAGEGDLSFPLPARPAAGESSWSGRVGLRPDSLSADDSFFYAFSHPRRPRLLCLHGNPDFFKAPNSGYFLQELFGAGKESLVDYDCDFLEIGRLREAKLSDYAAVILADFKELPAGASGELELFVRRGGGLWLLPGSRLSAEKLRLPWLSAEVGPVAAAAGAYGLVPDPQSAELRLWSGFELARVAVSRYHLLTPRPGARVWLRTADGAPLLVSGAHGQGRTVLWASSLDTAWSNLAVKPVFAAWAPAVLSLAAPLSLRSENRALLVGQPLRREWSPSEPAPLRVRLRAPDGRATTLWLKERRVLHEDTGLPGLYTMTEEGGAGAARDYAVNADRSREESDLTPEASPPWKELAVDSLRQDFWLAVHGKDARPLALLAAVSLLFLEMGLALPRAALPLLLVMGLTSPARAQQGDRFVWTQLKLGPTWNPYPAASSEVLELFSTVTSVLTAPEARVITLKDPVLFSSPLIILAGREAPPPLDDVELRNLRNYLAAGGMLWAEDTSGTSSSSFDRWLRRTLKDAMPETELAPIDTGHAIYRSFFLLRGAAGRVAVRATLEGLPWSGRMAVVYSRNDLLGVWVKDALGRPLLPCLPGGEAQRHNARKLTLNVLMYSLTGSYKSDAVHQPYLLQKIRSGAP